ncbi:MAG: cysteine desulfurase family protein [Thermoanaerobaculia bacterium]
MRIYLDNNATTPIHPRIVEDLLLHFRDVYGNASSIHKEGQTARRLLEEAREHVAGLLVAAPTEIVFTSGGTEANNAAIFGTLGRAAGGHVVTTAIEHPSVLEPCAELARRGATVHHVAPGAGGAVDPAAVEAAITPATRLVIVMLANNETGVVQPAAAVGAMCRARGIHFHCDAVQAAGRIPVDVEAIGADTLAISAHKMHGPKGIGALYVRRGTTLERLVAGGAQERRRRAGTESVPLAAAFGAAARIAREEPAAASVATLRDRLEDGIRGAFPDAVVNGRAERLPNTSNVCFRGADGEGIVIGLDLAGISVSTGSACASGRVEPSHVLLAMGLSEADAKSSVRFSLSRFTTAEEIDTVLTVLRDLVPRHARPEGVNPGA